MPPITFEQFMDQALYDPAHGYYARKISAVGRHGDFTTAPMLSKAPARAIAAWATKALLGIGCRNLIEIGPGEGKLACEVLQNLPWHLRWKTRLHLVETSAPLIARQQKLLGNRATWHRRLQDALNACGGHAVIFSNELVDAFPVRRFQKTAAGWQELAVHFDPLGRIQESLLPLAPLPASSGFLESHPVGQWIEVHESYHRYLKESLPSWKSGRMLTIDYGSTAEILYQRRPRGTVRAFLFQQRMENSAIYENSGRQDLTADVNFTDLQNWSKPWVSEQSLMSFQELLKETLDLRYDADQALSDIHGAGSAFIVLDQGR